MNEEQIQAKIQEIIDYMKKVTPEMCYPATNEYPVSWVNRNLINYGSDEEKELLGNIDEMLTELFIDNSGHPEYGNIIEAKKLGLKIYPGETDSFGWLTGCARLMGPPAGPVFVFG